MLDIKIVRTTEPKAKPQDESKLGFGKIFTDHMFLPADGPRYRGVPLRTGNF